jgi:hypothetical protein
VRHFELIRSTYGITSHPFGIQQQSAYKTDALGALSFHIQGPISYSSTLLISDSYTRNQHPFSHEIRHYCPKKEIDLGLAFDLSTE